MTEIIKQISDHMNAAIDAAGKPKVVIPNTGDIEYTGECPLFYLDELLDERITVEERAAEDLLIEGKRMTGFAVAMKHRGDIVKLSLGYNLEVCHFSYSRTEKHGDYFIAFYERA